MKYLNQTKHFETRVQQRSISETVINLVIRYGITKRHDGADVTFLDKKGRERLRKSWCNNPKDLERAARFTSWKWTERSLQPSIRRNI